MGSAERLETGSGKNPLQQSVNDTLLAQSTASLSAAGKDGRATGTGSLAAAEGATAGWKQAAVDFTGTMAAGVAGTAAWALCPRTAWGGLLRLGSTALVSGSVKVLVKESLGSALLSPAERTTSAADFAWGMVDGFAGVAGSLAEARAGSSFACALGKRYLGSDIGAELAAITGAKAIANSLPDKLLSAGLRGIAGGATGGAVWSLPHSIYNHRAQLDTGEGWLAAGKEVAVNTAFGAGLGGALGAGLTAAGNIRDIGGYAAAALKGDAGLSRVELLHFNDLHSSLEGEKATLSQLATQIKQLRAQSASEGRSTFLFDLGDNYTGNVASAFTDVGYVETKAINVLQPDAFIAGNHVADTGAGRVDIAAWVRNIGRVSREMNRELPALGTNIELVNYPGFAGPSGTVYKPYRILNMKGANGAVERVGVIGLTTEELSESAHNEVTYLNAAKEGQRWIDHLRRPPEQGGEGVNKVIALTHIGRSEDIALASQVQGISYIAGAHSHDAEPVIHWVKNAQTNTNVPIVQAGCKGKWLAHTSLVFKADGSADKYRSFSRLLPIHSGIAKDTEIESLVGQLLPSLSPLARRIYPTVVEGDFPLEGVRGQFGRQTELGTLVARATLEGVNAHLPEINAARVLAGLSEIEPMSVMLKHSQDVRAGLSAGQPSHRSLSDIFLHSGRADLEQGELAAVSLKGADIEAILNFSVADLPLPEGLSAGNRSAAARAYFSARNFFAAPGVERLHDYSGYFLQTDGLRFKYNLLKRAGQRVSDIEIRSGSGAGQQFVSLDREKTYNVLTLYNPVQLWGRQGVFGEAVQLSGQPGEAALAYAKAQAIKLSQVDLLAEHISSKPSLSPADYVAPNSVDLTPRPWQPSVRPRLAALTAPAALAALATDRKPGQGR